MDKRFFDIDGFKGHYPVAAGEETFEPGLWLTMSESNVKSAVADMQTFEEVGIQGDGKKIRAVSGENVLFEVTSRHKAFPKLEPFVGINARFVRFEEKEGEHGKFYKVRVVFTLARD